MVHPKKTTKCSSIHYMQQPIPNDFNDLYQAWTANDILASVCYIVHMHFDAMAKFEGILAYRMT